MVRSQVSDPRQEITLEDLRCAAEQLRKIVSQTAGLPGDSATDARLRDRLELAADVLDAAAGVDTERSE